MRYASSTNTSSSDSRAFLDAILRGDRAAAYRLLKACLDERGAAFVYEEVVAPALREIGEMWARDEITVADEHMATATATAALGALYGDFSWPASRTSRIFVACPPGEQHSLGARMLADLLALDGWDEVYFGADVPVAALAAKAAELEPRAVALSVTLARHLPFARQAAEAVRAASPTTMILLGGRAVASSSDAAVMVAPDAVARSAEKAVELVRAWK